MRFLRCLFFTLSLAGLLSDHAGAMGRRPGEEPKRLVIPGGLAAKSLPEPESRGARLFSRHCSQCHNLPNPKMYSSDEWPMMFNRMMSHARSMASIRGDITVPADDERESIVDYLRRNGLRAISPDDPYLKTPEAFQFVWFCSTCHALPDPSLHRAAEWESVIERMEGYRKEQKREGMTESEKEKILKFLTRVR